MRDVQKHNHCTNEQTDDRETGQNINTAGVMTHLKSSLETPQELFSCVMKFLRLTHIKYKQLLLLLL